MSAASMDQKCHSCGASLTEKIAWCPQCYAPRPGASLAAQSPTFTTSSRETTASSRERWTLGQISGVFVLAAGVLAIVSLFFPWIRLDFPGASGDSDRATSKGLEVGEAATVIVIAVVLIAVGSEVLAPKLFGVKLILPDALNGGIPLLAGLYMGYKAVIYFWDTSLAAEEAEALNASLGAAGQYSAAAGSAVYIFGLAALLALLGAPALISGRKFFSGRQESYTGNVGTLGTETFDGDGDFFDGD